MSENSGGRASAARDQETHGAAAADRRAMLKRLGRLALVTAPAVTLLLDKNAKAVEVVPISVA
jgi:hypothetical protein